METPAPQATTPATPPSGEADFSFLPSRNQFFLLLVLFFLIQTIGRALTSETLGLDDAEQALLAQKWSWGYGPQPPLYTWLVLCVSKTIGLSSFSLELLKNTLLFGLYILAYANMRVLTRSHAAGIAVAAALEMVPSIAYEAHRELTHSILASLLVMACVLAFLRMRPDRLGGYLALGLAAGMGFISKYNFDIAFAGLLLAGVSVRAWRPKVLNWRMAVALGVGLAVALPNLLWMVSHPDLALASAYKFQIDPNRQAVSIFKGIRKACEECLGHTGLLSAIAFVVFVKWNERKNWTWRWSWTDGERLLGWMLLWITSLVFLGIGLFAVRDCHSRWFQPLYIVTPLLVVSIAAKHFDKTRLKRFLGIGLLLALGMTLVHPARILLTESLRKEEILNAPFRQLASKLSEPLAGAKSILAEDRWLAGNLRVWFPDIPVAVPSRSPLFKPAPEDTLVWDASIGKKSTFAQRYATNQTETLYVEQRLKYHSNTTMKVAVSKPCEAVATP